MNAINLSAMDLKAISNLEMVEINGGDWNKGFNAGVEHGESAGKGIQAGLTVIGILAFFLL